MDFHTIEEVLYFLLLVLLPRRETVPFTAERKSRMAGMTQRKLHTITDDSVRIQVNKMQKKAVSY